MNHRAKSVVRYVVEGDKNRASEFCSQPLDGVEFLLQGQTYISQDVEAAEVKRAEEEVDFKSASACEVKNNSCCNIILTSCRSTC